MISSWIVTSAIRGGLQVGVMGYGLRVMEGWGGDGDVQSLPVPICTATSYACELVSSSGMWGVGGIRTTVVGGGRQGGSQKEVGTGRVGRTDSEGLFETCAEPGVSLL